LFRLDHDRHDDQAVALGLAVMALAEGDAHLRRLALAASVSPGGSRKASYWGTPVRGSP
jgi:hypothetical protein